MGYAISNTVRPRSSGSPATFIQGDVIFANDPYEGGGLHSHDVSSSPPSSTARRS